MTRNKSLLVFACLALSFGFAQNAFSQWWPATGTDTDNNWGSGGWGSTIEIYIAEQPLEELTTRLYPECTSNNPKFCTPEPIFGDGGLLDGTPAPKLNGLRLGPDNGIPNCDAEDPPPFNATITGNEMTTPPTIAVCIIRNDAGHLLYETAGYCTVDLTVTMVNASVDGGGCRYERKLGIGEPGEDVFISSYVSLLKERPDTLTDDNVFPQLTPTNVPNCDLSSSGSCTLPIGLPDGVVCNNSRCLSRLFPASPPFDTDGQIFLAKESENITALSYCVGDVDGNADSIACSGGNKQIETAEATVIIECTGSHSPSKDTLSQAGNNTHKFNYDADCFPELATAEPNNTIEFETVVNGGITNAGILPANECQFGGDGPSLLSCFVPESDLTAGCDERDPIHNPGVFHVDAIRGRAMVDISEPGDLPELVPLIATDDNAGNGYLCKNYVPPM